MIAANSRAATLTIVDDGRGMQRRDLRRFHDIAASSKKRGNGIGFASVGVKLGLLVSGHGLTETRHGKTHVATRWHLASRHRAPWKEATIRRGWEWPRINTAHPAYRRARTTRSEGYHIALATALALASLAVEPGGRPWLPVLDAHLDGRRPHSPSGESSRSAESRALTSSASVGSMRPEDVRAFAHRDWAALANVKAAAWLDQRRVAGVQGAFELADELRQRALAIQPGWPSAEERAEDLAMHVRLSETLRRAGRR